jgi:1-acyl-sn-glycerol-3-phosphate acyltransferase
MNKFLSLLCKIFLKPIVDSFLIKEVRGLENIPKSNFILAANHQSHLDQIATGYVCVPRSFRMIGQTDRYKGLMKFLLRLIYFFTGVIPLDRLDEKSKKEVIEKAEKVLKKGDILVIYPEGTRSRTGKIQEAKTGIAKIFLKTKIPILPVAIKGTFQLMPPGKSLPKIKKIIKINIGKPFYFEKEFEVAKNLNPESEEYKIICQKISTQVIEEIKRLFDQI